MNQPKVKYSLSNWDLVTVNPNYKTWDWKDLFCYWGVNVQSIIGFSLIASLYTIYSLNTFVVFFGTIRSFIHAHHFWQHVAFHENMTQWRLKLRFIDEQSSVDWLLWILRDCVVITRSRTTRGYKVGVTWVCHFQGSWFGRDFVFYISLHYFIKTNI